MMGKLKPCSIKLNKTSKISLNISTSYDQSKRCDLVLRSPVFILSNLWTKITITDVLVLLDLTKNLPLSELTFVPFSKNGYYLIIGNYWMLTSTNDRANPSPQIVFNNKPRPKRF